MALKTLDDLFLHTLKDILYAERQVLKALPKMERKAGSDQLKKLLAKHRDETEGQIERLEQVFEMLERPARGAKCDAILGIHEEAEELMDAIDEPDLLDAGIVASAQAVEHYEIARYGSLVAWAKELGHKDAAKLLEKSLKEESGADGKLSELAEGRLNRKAA